MKSIVVVSIFVLWFSFFGYIQIEGRISVKGSDPYSYLAITTTDNKEYAIVGKYKKEIWEKYQNQTIILKGKIGKKAVGPGIPAEFKVTKIIIKKK